MVNLNLNWHHGKNGKKYKKITEGHMVHLSLTWRL